MNASPRFAPLEQPDFQRLEHAAYLKGLLRPFKGKGLEVWAKQCAALRDDLINLATKQILSQAHSYPFSLLGVQLSQQSTGAGTTFLRWRTTDRSRMGVSLWADLVGASTTPATLIDDLHAMEQQRVVLNMQVSLLHTLARQGLECADKLAQAEATCLRRERRQVIPPAKAPLASRQEVTP